MRILHGIRARVERLEEIPVGAGGWAAGFLGIVAIRHLLELRSGGLPLYPPSAFYVHYVLAYLAPLLILSLILAAFSQVAPERVLRLMLLAWGLTLLPPLVDSLVARHHEAKIGYLELGETPWRTVFLRFFDPTYSLGGTTAGIRVETVVACALGAVYVLLRARHGRIWRSAATAFAVYIASLVVFTLPFLFVRALRLIDPGLSMTSLIRATGRVVRPESVDARVDQSVLIYLVPLTLALGAAMLSLARPGLLRYVLRTLRASEGWAWSIAAALGCCAGWRLLVGVPASVAPTAFDLVALVDAPLALLLMGGGLALLAPGETAFDPPPSGARGAGAVCLLGSALLAATVSNGCAAFAAIALGAGVLARGLPRILPWAVLAPQAAAGIATVASFLAGYALLAGDEAHILLPTALYLFVFLAGGIADLARAALPTPRLLARVRPASSEARAGQAAAAPLALAGSAVPLLALVLPMAALRLRPPPAAIVVAVVASAAVLLAARLLPPRPLAATALLGFGAAFVLLLADPEQALAWRGRALDSPSYYIRISEKAEAAGDLGAAAGAAAEAVRLAPGLAAAHQRFGMARYARGDYPAAIEELQTAVRLAPRDAELRGSLAAALLKAGRAEDALAVASEGAALDPDLPRLPFIRAQCLDALARTDEANEAWRDYIVRAARFPDEAPYVELARRRLSQGPPRP